MIMSIMSCQKDILPVASFDSDKKIGRPPLEVTFIDQSEGNPTNWNWDFGDGDVSSENNPVHIYSTEGSFNVSLEVTNQDGSDLSEKSNYINVDNSLGQPCPGITSFTYHGQTYNTVKIGNQCWMKENLNIGVWVDWGQSPTNNQIIEKHCYNDDTCNCNIYGGLYRWDEVMDYQEISGVRGICPDGWHIPTMDDWNELIAFLGGSGFAGGSMKDSGELFWLEPNIGATNVSGFSALAGGYRSYDTDYVYKRWFAYFWTSNKYKPTAIKTILLYYHEEQVQFGNFNIKSACSVRCIKD
jgi:uncharacterized protein (TIGR02145 family)